MTYNGSVLKIFSNFSDFYLLSVGVVYVMDTHGRKRRLIASDKVGDVLNEILCESDCSGLSWNDDSSDEIVNNDNVTVRDNNEVTAKVKNRTRS